jgi:hypothetical protein
MVYQKGEVVRDGIVADERSPLRQMRYTSGKSATCLSEAAARTPTGAVRVLQPHRHEPGSARFPARPTERWQVQHNGLS